MVAKDMSGKFSSVQAAINYATKVKKRDVYRENIVVPNTLSKIMLVGDGRGTR
uniref:Pectinesterase catalytic domain-containing protein n=1 Tax=Daucus carota subsp. sativus TaxID=79200 RepID=A0A162A299_DAUCS